MTLYFAILLCVISASSLGIIHHGVRSKYSRERKQKKVFLNLENSNTKSGGTLVGKLLTNKNFSKSVMTMIERVGTLRMNC